ncbi:E3 ubiquitin-protein ligase at4g11680-like protein [Trifolium pratense]|uniref:E3 ubiquitin-protein ligase at4g11680-like protein n=1 Tax=Trifolium pratense TaxID=57577 RepID=A0A2K3MEY0_TRIPR|nr:E3 ubiquitin-protein ligase at4g11680-like protein [Trifolium pratense]
MWQQEGATKEEIDQLPKYKFRMIKEFKKEGDGEESSRGVMTEYDSDSASEHVIAVEDAGASVKVELFGRTRVRILV